MITYTPGPHIWRGGAFHPGNCDAGRQNTLAAAILAAHDANTGGRTGMSAPTMHIKFDAMASHDITYVGIIQAARASGLERFPLPYVLTNCHNSLCAVGGTVNSDDHLFGLSAAIKYGGEFVPPHQAVIHQYMRERYAGGGKMILGSDSHTRYGPLGCLAIGEGGPELTKQLLGRTYDIAPPEVVAVYVEGKPNPGVGPQDAALALIAAVFPDGLVQNKILEFMGPGIAALAMDYRFGIDVMTTETTCLSSVWETDGTTQDWLARHGRAGDYKAMSVPDNACYDAVIHMNLSGIKPMIALPFHPSHAFTIEHFNQHADDILRGIEREAKNQWGLALSLTEKIENGRLRADQGYIGGCAGGIYQNIVQAEAILSGNAIGSTVKAFNLSIYPASQPMMLALNRKGTLTSLMASGASVRSAFCGPCFGAGDVPSSGGFSIRHATRNFPNREGSKPSSGQGAFVALMDARSIAATAKNGGLLTAADANDDNTWRDDYTYDDAPYKSRVYMGGGGAKNG